MLDPLLILDANDLRRVKYLIRYAAKNPVFACGPEEKNPKNPSIEEYRKNHVMSLDIGFEIDFSIEIQPGNRKFQHLSILHDSKQCVKPSLLSDLMILFDMGELDDSTKCMVENNHILHVMKEIKE